MSKIIKLIAVFVLFLIFVYNFSALRSFSRSILPDNFKIKVKEVFFGKEYLEEIAYFRKLSYNVNRLPKTQFENINLEKFLLSDLDSLENTHYNNVKGVSSDVKKFFIDLYKENIVIVTVKGKIKILKDYKAQESIEVQSNLKIFNVYDVLDIALINEELFISFSSKKNQEDQCSLIAVAKAKVNFSLLDFKTFYKTKECTTGTNALGGRIIAYRHNTKEGILLTTAASDNEKSRAQDDDSFYGKIWFMSLDGKEKVMFSKGHRNPQGLLSFDKVILSTEHGPYGGDEVNKIEYGKNYGFPNSSYGDSYHFDKILDSRFEYNFKKNHKAYSFEEPLFSFVPSIGISEIIKVPNNFSKYWQNNFLISSLNGRTLYRIEFGEKYKKIKYLEPIRIGERVRDLKYIPSLNSFVLALEDTGSIGFMKVKK